MRRAGLVVGAALVLTGCGGISLTELDEEAQSRGGGLGETLVLQGIDAVEEEIGDDVRFTTMTLSRDSVSIDVLVPGQDDELDNWIYRSNGELLGPDPVSGVGEADELRPLLIDPAEVALEDLDEIIDDALAEADLTGGYAQSVTILRQQEGVTITVSVTSPRDTAQVLYRGDGRRREVQP